MHGSVPRYLTGLALGVLAAGGAVGGCLSSDGASTPPGSDAGAPGVDGAFAFDAAEDARGVDATLGDAGLDAAPDGTAPVDAGVDHDSPDSSAPDSTAPDSGVDASDGSSTSADAGADAPADATAADASDASPPPDASVDAQADADASPDTGTDAGTCDPAAYTLIQLGAGRGHTCGLAADGTMLCWGLNADGQLGMGDQVNRFCPTVGLTGVSLIGVGQDFTCAVEAGNVACWGYNANGQLGQGDTTERLSPTGLSGLANVAALAAGTNSACALLGDGTVSCWGDNQFGEQGIGTTDGNPHVPTPVPGLSGVTALATGGKFSCAVLGAGATIDGGSAASGALACWGGNDDGQLGLGDTIDRHTPTIVPTLANVAGVSAGTAFVCATLLDGTVWCWGKNEAGELGTSATVDAGCSDQCLVSPTKVLGVAGASTVSASLGGSHACAATSGGTFCWGDNLDGCLGVGDTSPRSSATAVSGGLAGTSALATGFAHSCAIVGDGGLSCWGDNTTGELGLGPNYVGQFLTPTQVPGL